MNLRYPKTSYWPDSPSIGRDEAILTDPERFVGEPVVIAEKLDGSNTLLHGGEVFGRSVSVPTHAKWMALVRKHHAWKVREPDVYLYGEDIYGVHSIAYGPVGEHQTFYAFALRDARGAFASFEEVEDYATSRDIPSCQSCFVDASLR